VINFSISTLPTAPNSGSPSNFNALADAWCQALPTFGSQLNTLIGLINNETASISGAVGVSNPYNFDALSTADTDPGTGKLRLSNVSQDTSLVVRLSRYDSAGNDLLAWINTWDDSTNTIKGYLRIAKAGDQTKFIIFKVTALAVTSTYFNVTVAKISSGSTSPFSDADHLVLGFLPVGDAGAIWSGGAIANRAYTTPQSLTAVSNTFTIDASLSNVFYLAALAANSTLVVNNPADGQPLNIRVPQNSTGGFSLTLPANFSVAGALDTGASKVNWISVTYVSSAAKWEGAYMSL
jgi:hypothetical protein